MATRVLGDPDAAEEVAQETLMRAVDALRCGQLADPNKVGEYVRGIARRVIADFLRARRRTVDLDVLDQTPSPQPASDPLTALIADEVRARVRLSLIQLSEQDQEILRLAFGEGLTIAEIATKLGSTVVAIRKRKSRALSRLRRAHGTPDPERSGHESPP